VQSDRFAETASVTVCLFTSHEVDAPLARLRIERDSANGLEGPSWLMADKVVTIRRDRIARVVGRLADEDMLRVNRAIAVFLGLAG
jgi:mRNA interferase MazF